jgi:selenocysteine-specific elongation factor
MYRNPVEDNLSEQIINKLNIACVEVKDNSEQNKGGKFVSLLCENKSDLPFDETGSAIMLPAGKKISIRNIEKVKDGDYILSLKGIHRRDIKRGNVIVPSKYAVQAGKDAFILLPSGKERHEKGNYYIEGGVFKDYNHRNLRPSASISFYGRVGVIRFFYPFPLVTGARYYISEENNRDLITPVTLVFPGALGQIESSDLSARILKFGGRPSLRALYSIILRIKQYVELPFYLEEETFDGSVKCGSFVVMSREFDRIKGAILKRTSAVGGIEEVKLLDQIKGDKPLIQQIVKELIQTEQISKCDSYLMNITRDMRQSLSPIAKKLLSDLEESHEEISLSNISNPLFSETYKSLGRMKLIRILSGEIIISEKHYSELKSVFLKSCTVGQEIQFTDAKDILTLSRRVLIPFLEEMDSEGYFDRQGESRFVLKID